MFGLPFAFISISNVGFLTREFGTEVGQMDQIVLTFQNFYRATSIFSEPSSFAAFNIWNLIFVLFPFFTKSKQFISNNFLRTFIIILSLISLLISFSLSGLLMLTVIVSTLIFVEKVPIKKFILTFVISGIAIISADTFLTSYTKISIINLFSQRIEGLVIKNKSGVGMTEGESAPKRLNSMKNSMNLFVASPVFGIGAGNTYYHPISEERFADSSFFHILGETGIIGTFFFIVLLYYLLKISIFLRKYRLKYDDNKTALSTMQSIVLPYTLVFITLNLLLGNIVGGPNFWLYISIVLVTYRNTVHLEERKIVEV
jgi:O-antigen ligase